MVAGLQFLAVAQGSSSQNPPAQSPPADDSVRTAPAAALSALAGMQTGETAADTNSDLPQIPAFLGGKGSSAAFLSELERSNYLQAGVNVSAAYDDNPLLLSTGAASNTSVSIFPSIGIVESSSRMRWSLGYAGGLTINQNLASQNQDSQNLNFDSQFRLTPHVNLRVAENFSLVTGFFDGGNGADVVASPGGPTVSLVTPLATQRSSTTTVETNYHVALNDLIGASGSFNDLHFSNPVVGAELPLTDTQTATGSGFWLHRIFGADWGGASYRFDRISFSGGESRIHTFLAVDTLNLSNRVTLTGSIGPQYSENQGVAPGGAQSAPNGWSVAGGVDASWRGQRTGVSAGYSRTSSDGSGVLGAVRVQNVHGNFRCRLSPGWVAAVNINHATNQALTVPPSSINLTSAGISLEHNVRKSLGLRVGYSHDFQQQLGVPGTTPTSEPQTFDASRNRFFVTLSYQWAKPLGM